MHVPPGQFNPDSQGEKTVSNKADITVSYDVSNDFFRLWLDERMNYTSANFDDGPNGPTESLEIAQMNKLAILYDYAHLRPDMRVLDIGCGWGANLQYLSADRGVRDVHGITLSDAQHQEILRRRLPNVVASVCDYRTYEPSVKFDALISICMLEHTATPAQVRAGEHIGVYRDYFRRAHRWTQPGAYFALQTILRNSIPRNRKDIEDMAHITYTMFPGGFAVRLSEVMESASRYWEVVEVKTRRLDYLRTCAQWLERLRGHEQRIRDRFGERIFEEYDRYLSACVTAFEKNYVSLAQYSLKRI
ncbi:MAG: class I SAM-dependent methyltransferase [Burkholderiales bacterium]|nr:class I SAM-dependent methyltransferase [Burkholderiales bacterium]